MRRMMLCAAILAGVLLLVCGGCRMPVCPADEDPYVIIDKPPAPSPGPVQMLGTVIVFGWHAGGEGKLRSVRWMWSQVVDTSGAYNPLFDIVRDLNEHPQRYESKWSKWVPYGGRAGTTTTLGDDETLEVGKSYIFAVQAMDFCGRTTEDFDRTTNVRQFVVSRSAVPMLTVMEPFLGGVKFLGMRMNAVAVDFAPNLALNFRWQADASSYGGEVVGYRYGWDVEDIDDPNTWDVSFAPFHTSAPPRALSSGVHTFFVEALDNAGSITLGMIQVTIVPFTMERSLLWVDDLHSLDFVQQDWAIPTESQHDAFWLDLCGRAQGFNPGVDVYDAYNTYNLARPTLSLIGTYRNIIWSYGSNADEGIWDNVISFTPESMIGSGSKLTTSILAVFLAKGGHLLTEGSSERSGGLAACLLPAAQAFPMSLKCEITGNRDDCLGDLSGVNTIGYRDYCVTMLDKVLGQIRTTAGMPMRRVRNYDCMYPGANLSSDVWNTNVPGMPAQLNLWEEIIETGHYFDPSAADPRPGGFTNVEVYDPSYWMNARQASSQGCFHPLYLMRAKNSASALHNQAVALWLTRYADVVPEVSGGIGVAAPSLHFGFELWYFNREQVNQIIDAAFTKWQIKEGS
jgi:hypothetical protein